MGQISFGENKEDKNLLKHKVIQVSVVAHGSPILDCICNQNLLQDCLYMNR